MVKPRDSVHDSFWDGLDPVYSITQVYRLATAPSWNTWRTNVGFVVTGLLLGQATMAVLLAYGANRDQVSWSQWLLIYGGILLLLLTQLTLENKRTSQSVFQHIRMGCILVGSLLCILSFFPFKFCSGLDQHLSLFGDWYGGNDRQMVVLSVSRLNSFHHSLIKLSVLY